MLEDCVIVTLEWYPQSTVRDQRNEEKQVIDSSDVEDVYIKIREIRFIKLGKNI